MLNNIKSKYTQFCLAQGISILLFNITLFIFTCLLMIAGFSINNYHFLSDTKASGTALYINHFPKDTWIVEANLFYLIGIWKWQNLQQYF